MTQIIEYRTRNKGRASPGAECASASGNLGTIALVNSQFLFWLVSKAGGGETSEPSFRTVFAKGYSGFVVIRHSVTDLRDLLHEVRREKRVSLRSPRYAPELLICRIFSRDLSSSLSTRDLRFLRAGYAEYHPPSLILLRSLLRGGNGSEGTSQGNRVLRSRALLNPTARARRGVHRKICNRCEHCRLKYRS